MIIFISQIMFKYISFLLSSKVYNYFDTKQEMYMIFFKLHHSVLIVELLLFEVIRSEKEYKSDENRKKFQIFLQNLNFLNVAYTFNINSNVSNNNFNEEKGTSILDFSEDVSWKIKNYQEIDKSYLNGGFNDSKLSIYFENFTKILGKIFSITEFLEFYEQNYSSIFWIFNSIFSCRELSKDEKFNLIEIMQSHLNSECESSENYNFIPSYIIKSREKNKTFSLFSLYKSEVQVEELLTENFQKYICTRAPSFFPK